jgi:hypothetical protein
MKIEMDVKWATVLQFMIVAIMFFCFGYVMAIYMPSENSTEKITSCNSAETITNCLTATDLNRSDIGASIVLSRFCEGMGLQSSVLWSQDQQGNEYGMPICVKP